MTNNDPKFYPSKDDDPPIEVEDPTLQHVVVKEQNNKCTKCYRQFQSTPELIKHSEKCYYCYICKEKFQSEDELKQHNKVSTHKKISAIIEEFNNLYQKPKTTKKKYYDDSTEEDNKETTKSSSSSYLSVSQVLRLNEPGIEVEVKGTITGISRVFNMVSHISIRCSRCDTYTFSYFEYPHYNVSDAIAEAIVTIKGTQFVKVKCNKCDTVEHMNPNSLKPYYKSAVIIELQDSDTFNDMDRLAVLLFDDDTEDVRVGELVSVVGNIQILTSDNASRSNKKLFTWLYGEFIKYLNREDLTLTKKDVEAIQRFSQNKFDKKYEGSSVIDQLVKMFDPSIVGYEHVKQGLLHSAVSTSNNFEKRMNRISSLLIGDPALAKSKLGKRVTKLVPNSRYESGQSSTGKSLAAIIEKTEDNAILRPGAATLARGAICTINELGRLPIEDQAQLLDIMEEGEFTKNAFGKSVKIKANTTIVATGNPANRARWRDKDKIDLTNEFPILEPLRDRFDQVFVFRDRQDDKEIEKFADAMAEIQHKIDNNQLPDYTPFLVKYLQYAKTFDPKLTIEARMMLTNFYKEIKKKDKTFGTPRVQVALPKIAKAIAKLKLKKIADEGDATEAMQFYNVMLVNFQKSVAISQPLREVAYNECMSLLEEIKNIGGITLEELFETVCKRNGQLAKYFEYGIKPIKLRDNHRIRDVYELLLNNRNIKKIQEKPTVLQWLCDPCDPCAGDLDENKNKINENNEFLKNNLEKGGAHTSHTSHREKPEPEEPLMEAYRLSKNSPWRYRPKENS